MAKNAGTKARTKDETAGHGEHNEPWEELGDFTTTTRLLPIAGLAIAIGVLASFVALALLNLIGLFGNLFYFGRWSTARQKQRLLPVVNVQGQLVGVVTRRDILERIEQDGEAALRLPLSEFGRAATAEAYPNEPLRIVVYRMADKGVTRMPVVERGTRKFLGLISLNDLLKARTRHLEEERRRERTLKLRFLQPGGQMPGRAETPTAG